jgi:cation:H+ antiporter
MVILELGIFLLGLILLVSGSDFFVKGSAAIAKKLGISEFMIGLTLVAVGTSLPELASSIFASFKHESGLIIGNAVGSNIANIALIVGISATICAIKTDERMLIRDGYIMLFSTLLFGLMIVDGNVSWWNALILLILYLAYIVFLFETRNKTRDEYHFNAFIKYFCRFGYIKTIRRNLVPDFRPRGKKNPLRLQTIFSLNIHKDLLMVALCCAAVVVGARMLVDQAIFFAEYLNVPGTIIGASLVAFGTSVPELGVSIAAARKGYGAIAVGNIIGSNIANILLVIGVSGLIHELEVTSFTLVFTNPAMIVLSILLLVFIKSHWKIHRLEGIVFLALYAVFITILLVKF